MCPPLAPFPPLPAAPPPTLPPPLAAGRPLCHRRLAGGGHGPLLPAPTLLRPSVARRARAPARAGHAAPERRAGGDRSGRAVHDMGSAVQCTLELAPAGARWNCPNRWPASVALPRLSAGQQPQLLPRDCCLGVCLICTCPCRFVHPCEHCQQCPLCRRTSWASASCWSS